jgi:hypothetical protein
MLDADAANNTALQQKVLLLNYSFRSVQCWISSAVFVRLTEITRRLRQKALSPGRTAEKKFEAGQVCSDSRKAEEYKMQ